MAEAGSESTAIELEMAKRKEHELMKKFAENAAKITLQQIERDSADLKWRWSLLREDSQNLTILSSASLAILKEILRLDIAVTRSSFAATGLRFKVASNKRRLSTAKMEKAMIVKEMRETIHAEEKEFKSIEKRIEKEIKESSHLFRLSFVPLELELLNEKKATVEAKLRGFRKMMPDEEALLNRGIAEREENQRILKAQLITSEKNKITLKESLKLAQDARASCKTAIAVIEQAYLHRLLELKFNGYVEMVDITDVNILRSICARSGGWGGVILKFCVVNDELLELVAATVEAKSMLEPDRLYGLSVDENGRCHILELSAEEAGNYGFKPFCAGTVEAFDPETKKHTILYDGEIEILNFRKEKLKWFGDEQSLQEQKADHSSPPKEIMEYNFKEIWSKEKKRKRKVVSMKKQQHRVASPSKRFKGKSHGVRKSEVDCSPGSDLFVTESAKETCDTNVLGKDNLGGSEESEILIKKNEGYHIQEEERNEELVNA